MNFRRTRFKDTQMSAFSENMPESDLSRNDICSGEDELGHDENQFWEWLKYLQERFEVAEKWEAIQTFLADHPVAGVFLMVTLAMWTIPLLVFVMFVISSVALTLIGFFLVEGMVITVGTFVLGGVLFFVGLFAVGFSVFLLSSYYLYQMSGNIFSLVGSKIQHILFLTKSESETVQEQKSK